MDLGREHDFRVLAAVRGDIGLQMARQHRPDAITLDLEHARHRRLERARSLKHDTSTRHIPVHVISVTDDPHRGMRLGAKTFWAKPSEKKESLNRPSTRFASSATASCARC
jgi:CheY-like chemotaxis protein